MASVESEAGLLECAVLLKYYYTVNTTNHDRVMNER